MAPALSPACPSRPSRTPRKGAVDPNRTGFTLGYDFFRIDDERQRDFAASFPRALRSYAGYVNSEWPRPNRYPGHC